MEIIGTTNRLFRSEGWLFIFLSAIVVVPYQLIVLGVSGSHSVTQRGITAGTLFLLLLIEIAVIRPLISALQLQAVVSIGEGEQPRVGTVFARSVRVLPAVAAAEIIAAIGIAIGFLLFIIPGVYLWLRWTVVAQTAAFEGTNWPESLRRAGRLARRNYWRILGLMLMLVLISWVIGFLFGAIGGSHGAVPVILTILVGVLTQSYTGLATALLYFDLRVREQQREGVY